MALLSQPTVEELIRNVRLMLGQPNPVNSAWSDEELTNYLNEGIKRFYAEIIPHVEGQFTTTTDLDVTANSETIALPSDFFKVKNVWKKVSDGYVILNYRNSVNKSYSNNGGTGTETFFPEYYFRGNSLVLHPVPNFSETDGIRLEYVQFPEVMITGGDSLTTQISPVFKDLVEMYAVYKAKLKESLAKGVNTYSAAQANLSDLFAAFKDLVARRSYNPTYVQAFNPETF